MVKTGKSRTPPETTPYIGNRILDAKNSLTYHVPTQML